MVVKNKKQAPFFFYIFCSFLVIIIVFSLFFINVFRLSTESLNYEIIRHNSVELRHVATRFGDTISSASNEIIGTYLGMERLGLRFGTVLDAYEISRATQFLSEVVFLNNNYIIDIFLYSANSDIVITSNGSFVKQQFLRYSYYNPYYCTEFWDALSMSGAFFSMLPAKNFVRNDFPQMRELHLLPMAFKARAADEYVIVAFVDIKGLLATLGVGEDVTLFLYDGCTILYKNSDALPEDMVLPENAHHVQAGDTFYFREFVDARNFSQNQFHDLHFILQTSYSDIAASLQRQRNVYWILMSAAVIISLLISILLASTIQRPIKKTLLSLTQNNMPSQGSMVKEFDMIGRLTKQLIADNQNYDALLNKKNTLLRNYFYQMRLKNLHISDDTGEDLKEFFQDRGKFQLAHFTFYYTPKFYETMNINVSQATFTLSEYYQLLLYGRYPGTIILPVEDTKIISIITIKDEENAEAYMNELLKIMEVELDYVHTTAVLGNPFDDIGQLSTAYNNLYELIKYEEVDKENQLITTSGVSGFYFPPEQEQILINFLSKGDMKNAIGVLQQIFAQNLKRNTTLYYYRKLTEEIAGDCQKILADKGLKFPESVEVAKLTKQLENINKLDSLVEVATQYVEAACEIISGNLGKADHIITFVCDYIDLHFGEDIYLDMMSELLGITSNYLSHYFKEKTGVTFSDYLAGIRIKKAKEMLAETDMRVDEIALAVCYQHTNSFIRMFKKMTGQTPGEYRKTVGKGAVPTREF